MRLTFADADVETKSDDDSDVVEVYIPTLDDGRLVVWQVEFESDDPRFSGTMAMPWYLSRPGGGTLVTIAAHHPPPGLSAQAHVGGRSEKRRVGKECVNRGGSRGMPYTKNKNT